MGTSREELPGYDWPSGVCVGTLWLLAVGDAGHEKVALHATRGVADLLRVQEENTKQLPFTFSTSIPAFKLLPWVFIWSPCPPEVGTLSSTQKTKIIRQIETQPTTTNKTENPKKNKKIQTHKQRKTMKTPPTFLHKLLFVTVFYHSYRKETTTSEECRS